MRAVLVETTDEARGQKLMQLVNHPLVSGPGKRAGLFWFSLHFSSRMMCSEGNQQIANEIGA